MQKEKQIIPFNYGDSLIRTVEDENGEPLWVAKDICDVLELKDVNRTLSKLDEDEKGTQTLSTLGGLQKMSVINESGLYNLILRSNKPEAKKFKKWVTSEVLPSIRKTGKYDTTQNNPQSDIANQTTNNGIDSVMFNSMMSNQNKLLELFIMQSQKTNMLIENILVNNTKKPQQQNKKSISEEIDTVYSSDYPQEMYNTSNNNYDDLKDKEPENINSRFECIYLPQGRRKILNGMLELFKMKDIEKKHHKGHIYYRLTLAQIEEHLGFTTQKAYIFQTIKILIDKKVIEKLKTSYRNVYFRVTDTIQNFNDEEI